jgi:hypothetical protein
MISAALRLGAFKANSFGRHSGSPRNGEHGLGSAPE